jgi:hypothetical protein
VAGAGGCITQVKIGILELVVDAGTALEAAKSFVGGVVDLAVVRGDVLVCGQLFVGLIMVDASGT